MMLSLSEKFACGVFSAQHTLSPCGNGATGEMRKDTPLVKVSSND